jgi:hypothetical protein
MNNSSSLTQKHHNYGFALSNPKFEYWLLLHFEDGKKVRSSRACIERLKRHVPNYDKGIEPHKYSEEAIKKAIARAEARDTPRCNDWPRKMGCTTVYRLVQGILDSGGIRIPD